MLFRSSTTKPFALVDKDWTGLDLNLRIEATTPNVNIASNPLYHHGGADYFFATSEQASTVGLKWIYTGRTYTSVNYSVYGLNGNYGSIAGSSLFNVQQQFYF